MLLSALGGLIGIAASRLAIRVAPSIMPPGLLPARIRMQFDGRLALVAAILSIVTAVIAAAAPAWHATRPQPTDLLAARGRAATRTGWTRQALAIAEIAGAVLLLSAAGLMIRTVIAMSSEDRGFNADSVLTTGIELPINRYTARQLTSFYRQAEAVLLKLPGVL